MTTVRVQLPPLEVETEAIPVYREGEKVALTPRDVAKALGKSYRWAVDQFESGAIPGRKIGGSWYISAAEFQKLLNTPSNTE